MSTSHVVNIHEITANPYRRALKYTTHKHMLESGKSVNEVSKSVRLSIQVVSKAVCVCVWGGGGGYIVL